MIALTAVAVLLVAQAVYDTTTAPPLQAATTNAFDPGQTGPYEIGFTSFVLTDPSRPGDNGTWGHRPIPVYVWYPVDPATVGSSTPEAVYPLDPIYGLAPDSTSSDWEKYGMDRAYQAPVPSSRGPFPLLMFSPGWGAEAWHHTSVGTRLASHGFVVAVVYHFGDQWWPWEPAFDPLAVASYNRPRDVSFALTDLLQKNATNDHLLYRAISPEQVAAGGWSLGGYASMTLAGGDDSVCDTLYGIPGLEDPPDWTCVPTPRDPRIKAIVPQDGSNQVLHFNELARIKLPAMGMGEEWNMVLDWQARQHAAFSGRPAYRADVFNTNHQSFSDLCEGFQVMGDRGLLTLEDVTFLVNRFCGSVTAPGVVHPLVSKYQVAFLKTHLAGEAGYQHILTPGWAMTREPLIEFFVTEKRNPNAIDDDWPAEFIYFKHQPGSEQARAEKNAKHTRPILRLAAPR
jgi:hypothetical protein